MFSINIIYFVLKHTHHNTTIAQKPLLSIFGEKVANMTRNFLSFSHKLLGGWKAASSQLLHLLPHTQT